MRFSAATVLALSVAHLSCSPAAPASALVQPPEYAPKGEAKCGVVKSQAEPLIVEWPSAARGKLEAQLRRGLVAVRYGGCEMEILGRCRAPGAYGYASIERKHDRVTIRSEDELYASIPVYAASFEGKLKTAGQLNVAMTLVGRFESDRSGVRKDELQGECEGATHLITAATAGAFEFFAGAGAEVGGGVAIAGAGAGARSSAQRELLTQDGDEKACDKSTRADKQPPEGCGALLRIEVVPLDTRAAPAVAATPLPSTKPMASAEPVASSPPPAAPPDPALPDVTEADRHNIQTTMSRVRVASRVCYERGLKATPGLSGTVKVNVTVGPAGEVLDVSSAGSSMPDVGVQTCVLKAIRALTFAPPAGGKLKFSYPFAFASQ